MIYTKFEKKVIKIHRKAIFTRVWPLTGAQYAIYYFTDRLQSAKNDTKFEKD